MRDYSRDGERPTSASNMAIPNEGRSPARQRSPDMHGQGRASESHISSKEDVSLFKMKRSNQLALDLRTWGGKRKGAGRKRRGTPSLPHRARPDLSRHHPVHLTLRLVPNLPNLRRGRATLFVIRRALKASRDRDGFRLVHFAVLANHFHLIVEARDAVHLSRGTTALEVRVARALNALWTRCGRVFGDRYHAHVLTTPRETRAALAYVLLNQRHHEFEAGRPLTEGIDPFTSGMEFDGWTVHPPPFSGERIAIHAQTWLLRVGWLRSGRVALSEIPST